MGCTPSSRRSRTETELKYSCPNETANEDTNNQTEPLNCSQKSSESKPFLPMTYYDNNKDLSNCKDLSVMNVLMATQENSPILLAQTLEKVVEILKNTDVHSPTLTGFPPSKADDQLTNDLLTGLIHSNKATGMRRMSYEQVVRKNSSGLLQSPTTNSNFSNLPENLKTLFDYQWTWHFNIIELERLTEKRPLFFLGLSILSSFNVCSNLNCDESTLRNWLVVVESQYRDNPYHNSTHAADVMQATSYFLRKPRLKAIFDPLDEVISLISAIIHDIDHPGKSSAFLCNSNNELAILYNDISVLESHHAAQAFKITLSDDQINIFKNLDRDTYKEVRQSIIDMVLATEMTKHFEHLSKFISVLIEPFKLVKPPTKSTKTPTKTTTSSSSPSSITSAPVNGDGDKPESSEKRASINSDSLNIPATPENIVIVKRMLIKCADVCNPTRPLPICNTWAERIAEEYCNQTDEEKALGLPVVMPAYDRATCSIPKSQIGFIDFFAHDMFEAWDAFGDFPELMDNMNKNYAHYKEEERKESDKREARKSSTCKESVSTSEMGTNQIRTDVQLEVKE
ncbi:high affinity cAMP-specific and IBMX-insensitive 3',5'-cyclic phosphodiesterase 8A isoform X2 [Tetranychus urticae]|uniref:high affinity cAMP-specific and IBMX-insensitive 3',5'-cyclic phosphodiesterase 8A isoform X2 n=1 Tax=Tetranychus urticae TaxID=32264 RepID=UPI00077C0CE9|nr:high affinity cAMP-specific and IBMX-insensitive 3',5'-cyclic phosphodiesterase 8A isoform X2 [Tetranychus urticae]